MAFIRKRNRKKTAQEVQGEILVKTEEILLPTYFHGKRFGTQACFRLREGSIRTLLNAPWWKECSHLRQSQFIGAKFLLPRFYPGKMRLK